MTTTGSPYAVPLTDLVASARVAPEELEPSMPQTRPGLGLRLDGPQLLPYGDGATAGDDD